MTHWLYPESSERGNQLSQIRVGSYVTHSQRPAWGLGKVFGQSAQHVLVGFQNLPESERIKRFEWRIGLLDSAAVTADPVLDSWNVECDSTCHYIAPARKGKKKVDADAPLVAEWTLEQAYERFHQKYGGAFQDPWYRPSERDWKFAQHQLWAETVGKTGLAKMVADAPQEVAALILKVIETGHKPLLQPKSELSVLRDAFSNADNVKPFLNALVDMLDAPAMTSGLYSNYLHTFETIPLSKDGDLNKWPTVTIIPFLAQPSRHLFVKPVTIRKVAKAVGFDLKYTATPRWETYERVLAFGTLLLDFLQPKGATDMIDVQSFIGAIAE